MRYSDIVKHKKILEEQFLEARLVMDYKQKQAELTDLNWDGDYSVKYFWQQDNFLTQKEINEIHALAFPKPMIDGTIGNKPKNAGDYDEVVRKGSVCWIGDLPTSVEIKLQNALVSSKKECFADIHIHSRQKLQYAMYEVGAHYDWHADQTIPYEDGTIRQLSFTIQLTDDYEGGVFEYNNSGSVVSVTPKLGSLYIFPSFVRHRVTPITVGCRVSLVGWYLGKTSIQ